MTFRIFGLYQDVFGTTMMAKDEKSARRQYHNIHPGLIGTILRVEEIDVK